MFEHFLNPTVVYMRRIQRGLEEARMAALEHESAAEHHAALATMYRERVRRLQDEMENVTHERTSRAAASHKARSEMPDTDTPEDTSAAQIHRMIPRYGKRDDASSSTAHGILPQGAAG